MPLPEGEHLAEVAREAAASGEVVYLTDPASGWLRSSPPAWPNCSNAVATWPTGAGSSRPGPPHEAADAISPSVSRRSCAARWHYNAGRRAGRLYAYVDADDQHHQACAELLEIHPGPLIVPTLVVTEVVYLLGTRLGVPAEMRFLADPMRIRRKNWDATWRR